MNQYSENFQMNPEEHKNGKKETLYNLFIFLAIVLLIILVVCVIHDHDGNTKTPEFLFISNVFPAYSFNEKIIDQNSLDMISKAKSFMLNSDYVKSFQYFFVATQQIMSCGFLERIFSLKVCLKLEDENEIKVIVKACKENSFSYDMNENHQFEGVYLNGILIDDYFIEMRNFIRYGDSSESSLGRIIGNIYQRSKDLRHWFIDGIVEVFNLFDSNIAECIKGIENFNQNILGPASRGIRKIVQAFKRESLNLWVDGFRNLKNALIDFINTFANCGLGILGGIVKIGGEAVWSTLKLIYYGAKLLWDIGKEIVQFFEDMNLKSAFRHIFKIIKSLIENDMKKL